jgi:hypothetical protein
MSAPIPPARRNGRERRRWSRYAVTAGFPAELVTEDGRIACRIENVSLAGAKLRVSHPVRLEGHVRLDHGGRSGPGGRCLWAKADSLGVRFELSDRSVALALTCIRQGLPKPAESSQASYTKS